MMERKTLNLGGIVDYDPNFLSQEVADGLFVALLKAVNWEQHYYTNYKTGAKLPVPRHTAWYADSPKMAYSYSGITEKVQPWLPSLLDLRSQIENITGATYNSVLLNLYRNGRDSVGMHADNEKELGIDANIASVSLGVTRLFQMRQIDGADYEQYLLTHGSLLIMSGTTQHHFKHSVPKDPNVTEPRINLTFRKFLNDS